MIISVAQNKICTADALAARDTPSFERLFDAYHARIYAMCWRYTHSEQDAQDLTQDIFILIYRKLQEFRGTSAMSTWIYRVALNRIYENRRGALKRKTVSLNDRENDGDGLRSRDEYKRYELSLDIARAVAELPEKYQSVIELYYYQDLAQKEIAKVLGIPVKTVETRLKRAKDKLEGILSAHGIGKEHLHG